MNDAGQLVLRFRDIERPLGETVRLHRKVIDEQGWTWWGWLYRSYERVPTEVFDLVSADVSVDSPIEVFLYDTGQALVYSTNCVEMRYQNYLEASPDPRLTPSYYNARSAPAWFRLTAISECDPSRIVGRVCSQMPSATEDCSTDLADGVIHKLSDLRRQEVTLWLIS